MNEIYNNDEASASCHSAHDLSLEGENLAGTLEIRPVAPGIFTLPPYDQSPPRLLGGYCRKCDMHYFPKPKYCRKCLGEVRLSKLDSCGRIYSFTAVRKMPPYGLPAPYGIGYVDLRESGLRIFCLLDPEFIDAYRIGMHVQLAVAPMGIGLDGSPCLRPYFTRCSEKRK